MKEIIIPRPEELKEKKRKIKEEGSENLHIISDFDATLTKAFIDGKRHHSSWALIREKKYLSEEYIKRNNELFDHYYPIEMDPSVPMDEKIKYMDEWWLAHLNLMIDCGMNKKLLQEIAEKNNLVLREGTSKLLEVLETKKIPLLIFSAGQGNVIENYLKLKNLMKPNIHIISNFYSFDDEGKVKGFVSNPIHTFNKGETSLKNTPYYEEAKERTNVILLGDTLGDLQMSKGIHHNTLIKVGFLNENIDEQLEKFKEKFDIIILNDGSMAPVNEILNEIL